MRNKDKTTTSNSMFGTQEIMKWHARTSVVFVTVNAIRFVGGETDCIVHGHDGRQERNVPGGRTGRRRGCRRRHRRRSGRRVGALGFAFPRLDAVLAHGQRTVDAVQFVVEAARVAHRLAVRIAAPQSRHRRGAVGTAQSQPTGCTLHSPPKIE